jgi:2'-5' RNA ligase
MIRAFVGLPLPEPYQEGLDAVRRHWRDGLASKLSWTRRGNWHLTLKFLGDVEEERLEDVRTALATVEFQAFTLQAGGGGFFPPPKRGMLPKPRVVWAGLAKGAAEARVLAKDVEAALQPLGFEPERRPFSPHLTLARVKWAGRDPWEELLADLEARTWPEITVDEFVLWQSVLAKGGPSYIALAKFPATQAGPGPEAGV